MTLILTFKSPPDKTSHRVNISTIFTTQPSVKLSKNFDKPLVVVSNCIEMVVSFDHFDHLKQFKQTFINTEGLDSLALSRDTKICTHLCRPKAPNFFHHNQLSKQNFSNYFSHKREDGLRKLFKTLVHHRDNPCTKFAKPLTNTGHNPLQKMF